MQKYVEKHAWTSRSTEEGAALLVLRWPTSKPGAGCVVRSEFEELPDAHCTPPSDLGQYLQVKLLRLAVAHGVALPPALYTPMGPTPADYAEKQVAACCNEFAKLVERTPPFVPTPIMVRKMQEDQNDEPEALGEITGVYLRLVPRGTGRAALTRPDAMHAMLLAAVEREEEARHYLAKNTMNGVLLPPDEETAKHLLLHTVATQIEPLCLSGMVTLYGSKGKPGAPIRSPG